MYKNSTIFFCQNKISYYLALAISKNKKSKIYGNFFSSADSLPEFGRLVLFKYLLIGIFCNIEIVIPHTVNGLLFRFINKYCKKVSYIDDGMDTFRDKPINVNLKIFRKKSLYYIYQYNIFYAAWLNNFNVIEVSPLIETYIGSGTLIDFNEFDSVVIESRGIILPSTSIGKSCIVRHPSKNKQVLNLKNFDAVFYGDEVLLEESLRHYQGNIYIGESFTAILLIHMKKNFYCNIDPAIKRNLSVLNDYLIEH